MSILGLLVANWRLIGLGMIVLFLGIQTFRLDLCQKGRHKDQVAAQAKVIALEGSLAAQNEAVAKLGRESADRRAKAEKAFREASTAARSAREEAARLRGLATAQNAPSASECPAGEALKEIRKFIGNG